MAQYSSPNLTLPVLIPALYIITKEAAVDQKGPKPDHNFDEEMEDQETDGLYHNLTELCTSRRKIVKATRGGGEEMEREGLWGRG